MSQPVNGMLHKIYRIRLIVCQIFGIHKYNLLNHICHFIEAGQIKQKIPLSNASSH